MPLDVEEESIDYVPKSDARAITRFVGGSIIYKDFKGMLEEAAGVALEELKDPNNLGDASVQYCRGKIKALEEASTVFNEILRRLEEQEEDEDNE